MEQSSRWLEHVQTRSRHADYIESMKLINNN